MKKIRIFVAIVSIAIVFISSCQKDKVTDVTTTKKAKSNSSAQKIGGLKTTGFEGSYLLGTYVGHTSTECGNSCSMVNGVRTHLDCKGFGNKCTFTAYINVSKVQPDNPNDPFYNAIGINNDEPTTDTTFLMPYRSFYIENENFENGYIWMNIPEQTLIRNETYYFIYRDVTFTNEQLYQNN